MSGVAFVAHCLLNQNAKTHGGARCPGVYSPLVEEIREHGWRIEQMPCPELAFTGLHRFWAVKEQLDTSAYRRHCRRIAVAVAGAIEVHVARGDDVILVGIEGSPSMGVHITSSDPELAGEPRWPENSTELSPGSGIFMEELTAELAERGVTSPRAMGIAHQLPGHDSAGERAALAALMEG
jgi:predicted secreted protein